MGVLTSQKIAALYERYREIEVIYTKEIIQVTGLQSKQIYLKCVSDVWPCVIYSSSFQGAKIAVNIKSGLIPKLQQANNMVSLRFCFKDPFQGGQVTFFVSARSMGYSPHKGSEDVGLFTIQFTQRPSDDLIEIMGRLLDANVNSTRRKGERVLITAETLRKLGLRSSECAVFIQGVPRRCILRDISFGGARIIIQGVVKFLLDREAALRIDFDDPRESFLVNGKFTQAETVAFRKDMVVLNLAFNEGQIPMGYKVRVNEYLATIRPGGEGEARPPEPALAASPAAVSASPAAASAPAAAAEAAGRDDFSTDDEPEEPEAVPADPAAAKAAGPAKPAAPKPAAAKPAAPKPAAARPPAAGGKP
ncbi:MAG: PilZ domain-containing protein [Treponema sp.]|jgi:hypothetical protein|nr:PilZ domain-containing protein [Treponema sp.]